MINVRNIEIFILFPTLDDLRLVKFNVINYDSSIITNAKLKLGCGMKNHENYRNYFSSVAQ